MNNKAAIQKLVEQQKFAEAMQMCRQMRVGDGFVKAKIEDQIALAESAFQNRDYSRSIDIFKTIIGVSEASIVLSRFFKPHLNTYLIDYLIEVHLQGYATPAYTKLLFNLFIQCQAKEKLNNFIDQISKAQTQRTKTKKARLAIDNIKNKIKMATSSKSGSNSNQSTEKSNPASSTGSNNPSQQGSGAGNDNFNTLVLRNFDINMAVEMLKKGGMVDEASRLSHITGISMTSISSLIEAKKYSEAATQIFDHYDEPIGYAMLMNFGPFLLNSDTNCVKIIEQTATLIWKTNSDQITNQSSNSDSNLNSGNSSNSNLNSNVKDSDFVKLFWGHPQSCYNFLKSIVFEKPTELFADTLVSLLIPRSKATQTSFFGNPSVTKPEEAIELINDTRLPINCLNLLTICVEGGFLMGTTYLLSRMGRNADALSLLLHENATNELFKWVVTIHPTLQSEDWLRLLAHFSSKEVWPQLPASVSGTTKVQLLQHIIKSIKDDINCSRIYAILFKNKSLPVEILKNGPCDDLVKIQEEDLKIKERRKNIQNEIQSVDDKIKSIHQDLILFEPSVCKLCGEQIRPPFICFFCGHCVHSKCAIMPKGGSQKPVCPVCYHDEKSKQTQNAQMSHSNEDDENI